MGAETVAIPVRRAIIAPALPRSRTLPLLRTPAPYRHLVVLLALVGLSAALISLAPALLDRARLTEAMSALAPLRIEPSLFLAERGRWPRDAEMPWVASGDTSENIETRTVTEHGIAVTLARKRDRVEVELTATAAPGGTLRWHCRASAPDDGATLDPLSLPSVCRP